MGGFTDTFIRRPVFASVIALLILLLGIVSYMNLTIRQFPKIDSSVVTVTTSYPGASAKLMEGFVSTPLESAIAGVNGIDYMTSNNTEGTSSITVYFKLGYNINTAVADVSDKVSSVRWRLPKDINDPVIAKQDPNATPIMYIAFADSKLRGAALVDYMQRVIQPQLETLNGVGEASIFGLRNYAMRIWLNPHKMAAHDITPTDVQNALARNNLQSASGRFDSKYEEFTINASTDLHTAQQFNNLVVKDINGQLIRIKDIGKAVLGETEQRASFFTQGHQANVIGIIPRSDANPLEISKEVNKVLNHISDQRPSLSVNVMWDSTSFIAASVTEVKSTILEAGLIVILVIFLFLGSFRSLWIPAITIPLSLVGVCTLMLAFGFSLNTLTFLAMVLAIGMVVDDAIVVLENIQRHVESGMKPLAAAIVGAREIKFAVISMTLTLAAVFAPIGFMTGLLGALFKEFAFTLALTVIISGVLALVLSPMMCSRILKEKAKESRMEKWVVGATAKTARGYRHVLRYVLNYRVIVLLLMIPIMATVYYMFEFGLQSELAPQEDMGAILTIVRGPASANLAYTEKYTSILPEIYKTIPEAVTYGIINGFPSGVNSAISFLVLKPWSDRKRSVGQIITSMFPALWAIPGVSAFPVNPYSLPGTAGLFPIEFVLKTTGSYQELLTVMGKVMSAARQNPGLVNLDTDLKFDKPQFDIDIHRNKAGILGIPMSSIGEALNVSFGQPTSSRFEINGRGYDVIPQLEQKFRHKSKDLDYLYLRSISGQLVPLSNLVSIEQNVGPRSLNHFQQLRAATISASLAPGYTEGQAVQFFEQAARKVMPSNMQYDWGGATRQFIQATGKMAALFAFALIFIYLVLAAQFESFRDPFIIMVSVLLSTFGALVTLKFIGGTLNIYTEIGIITLVGLISKHGILMVEFANQQQNLGKSVHEAILNAAEIRLRPILMTTAAMVLGVMPLAFASGAGSVSRHQIGWTIAGGMFIGTFFTLIVVPTVYTYLATKKKAFSTGDAELDKTMS